MKKLYILSIALLVLGFNAQAQTIEELKAKKAELSSQASAKQAEVDALNGEINSLNSEITILSGWDTGFSGNIGFDLNKSSNWVASPNADASSSSLALSLATYANKTTEKMLWRNKGLLNMAWQDVNLGEAAVDTMSLFDNGTVDILNLSSLYGYRIHEKFAITALAELNTSVSNFVNPGAFDFGVGGTWTPSNHLVVVIHPLNYHAALSRTDGIDSAGALGLKLRADYTNSYTIAGKNFNMSSTLTGFVPYSDEEIMEYTWVNSISFELWKGIGVGIGAGLRKADFESPDTQTYYSFGLTYNL
ncbi:MAG: DUF3078 domain-containing protein [Saprospiraceae bacterium]|nr:DUF3078 domain-containing protein [Saprospiraceae bacterium]